MGVAQSEVWQEIGEKQMRMSVDSPTGANRDTFEAYGDRLRMLEDAFPLQPGQCGAVLAIGDDLCLDTVSRPDAFALLWPKLRAGYLLDALERLDQRPADVERIAGFVDEVADAAVTRGPSAGLGEDVRLRGPGVIGSGLELDGERIQLSAFTSSDGGQTGLRAHRPAQPAALTLSLSGTRRAWSSRARRGSRAGGCRPRGRDSRPRATRRHRRPRSTHR